MKNDLQNIIQGTSRVGKSDLIQNITSYLRERKVASLETEGTEYSKQQEEEELTQYINCKDLWYRGDILEPNKIGQGAEQKVYYNELKGVVIKTNDSIFFEFWLDYFNNLLVHNYFFPDTYYTLLGFNLIGSVLYATVEQPYIVSTDMIDLEAVKQFLKENGFENTRRNDYYNKTLGIILEDLHDENVINSNQVPFFIDTVFYLTGEFYK